MFQIDFTLVVTIFLFGITYVVLNKILFKPMTVFLAARDEQMKNLRKDQEQIHNQAEDVLNKYHQAIRDGRQQGAEKVERATREAMAAKQSRVVHLEKEITKNLKEKELEVRKELEAARDVLESQVDEYAGKIANKVMGRKL